MQITEIDLQCSTKENLVRFANHLKITFNIEISKEKLIDIIIDKLNPPVGNAGMY